MASGTEDWHWDALPQGTVLNGYRIEAIIGRGGFGITYRAADEIDQEFAVKECFPRQFVCRRGLDVLPTSPAEDAQFHDCRERFLREARALVQFAAGGASGVGVVHVVTLFQAHGTAYIVMELLRGRTLEDVIGNNPNGLPQDQLRGLMLQVLDALGRVHAAGLLHRDIKPSNIILRESGEPTLIDFGAVRRADHGQTAFTQIYSQSYAPIEQIVGEPQGPMSDLYAFGATFYRAIGGKTVDAFTRNQAMLVGRQDPQPSAQEVGGPRYAQDLLAALDTAMRVAPDQRPQSAAELITQLRKSSDTTVVKPRIATPAPTARRKAEVERHNEEQHPIREHGQREAEAWRQEEDERCRREEEENGRQKDTQGQQEEARPQKTALQQVGADNPATTDAAPLVSKPQTIGRVPARRRAGIICLGAAGIVAAVAILGVKGGFFGWPKSTMGPQAVQAVPPPIAQLMPAPGENEVTTATTPSTAQALPSAADAVLKARAAYDIKDYGEAARWYRIAADQGDAEGEGNLARFYMNGSGVTQDYAEAMRWAKKAADQNNARGEFVVGRLYESGWGVSQDYAEAMRWYQKAADQGDDLAENNIGYLYAHGLGVQQDYAEAMRWYQKAADQGYAQAQDHIGDLYAYGQGVQQDYAEAMRWYQKAADQGHAQAQDRIGYLYAYGQGVQQDYAEAIRWYQKAADQGYAAAQSHIGYLYAHGQGVKQDYTEARRWYQKAADQGYAPAQYNLGTHYAEGKGVHRDVTQAQMWMEKAAAGGDLRAKNWLANRR